MEGSVLLHSHSCNESESSDEYQSDSDASDSSGELLSSNVGVQYKAIKVTSDQRFEDYTKALDYETMRNKYFTPEITKHSLSIEISGTKTITDLTVFGIPLDNVIGFKFVKAFMSHSQSYTGSNHIDIIIDEIPYIACIKNSTNTHLIHRLPVYKEHNVYYENKNLFVNNYFTPIKLSTLNIVHTNVTGHIEVEITVLNQP